MDFIINCLTIFSDAMIGGLIVLACVLIACAVCAGISYLLNLHDGYRSLRKIQKENKLEED